MNTKPCNACANYYAIKRAGKNGPIPTLRGICLALSVYASNAADAATIPPLAKKAVLPFGRHVLTVVKGSAVKQHCQQVK